MKDVSLSRRALLRDLGLGAGLLPLLGATRPLHAAAAFPCRVILVLQTNGLPADPGKWRPSGAGDALSGLTFPEVTKPLLPHRDHVTILQDLRNPEYGGAGHGAYGTIFSGGPNSATGEYWVPKGATLDQICADAAAKRGAQVPFRTLPLQVQVDRTGEKRIGACRAFFTADAKPVTPEASPARTAERLFAGRMAGDPALDRLRAERRSVLDLVKADLGRFSKNLGADDRSNVEAYLQSVREIEKGIAAPGPGDQGRCVAPEAAAFNHDANDNYPKTLGLQLDLIVAALRCDLTRVATLQLGSAHGGELVFSWLGITGSGIDFRPIRDWHDVGHKEVRGGVHEKAKIDAWFMEQFAGLLRRLAAVPEGGGTMLDNTVVVWAHHMQVAGNHDAQKLPWFLGGKGGGYFKTGQYLRSSIGQGKTRVMCEVANAMGADLPFYGNASHGTPLPGLRA